MSFEASRDLGGRAANLTYVGLPRPRLEDVGGAGLASWPGDRIETFFRLNFLRIKRKVPSEDAVRLFGKFSLGVKGGYTPPKTMFGHSKNVRQLIEFAGYSREVQIAAFLHDLVEDLGWKFEDLKNQLGPSGEGILKRVALVTHRKPHEKWEDRYLSYISELETCKDPVLKREAIAISCADKIENLRALNYFMAQGFPVNSISTRGFDTNLRFLEQLDALYKDGLGEASLLYATFCGTLKNFRSLGEGLRDREQLLHEYLQTQV